MEIDADKHVELTAWPLRIGEWTYYPDLLKIEHGVDQVKLEPKNLLVCLPLAGLAGSQQCWNGRPVVGFALVRNYF